jgi:hypothetical protein
MELAVQALSLLLKMGNPEVELKRKLIQYFGADFYFPKPRV